MSEDFTDYFPKRSDSKKERLIAECNRRNVSIYIDDPSENTGPQYESFRGVASEAELERRLREERAVFKSTISLWMAAIAILISLASLGQSIGLFD